MELKWITLYSHSRSIYLKAESSETCTHIYIHVHIYIYFCFVCFVLHCFNSSIFHNHLLHWISAPMNQLRVGYLFLIHEKENLWKSLFVEIVDCYQLSVLKLDGLLHFLPSLPKMSHLIKYNSILFIHLCNLQLISRDLFSFHLKQTETVLITMHFQVLKLNLIFFSFFPPFFCAV